MGLAARTIILSTLLLILSTVAWADTVKGLEAFEDENYVLAYEEFQKSAKKGDPIAQYMIGDLYYYGDGVEENKTEAARWFRLSAEQGDVDAQWSLGFMYDNGEGVSENKVEAVRWYRLAAEHGHSDAENSLGYAYDVGEGAPKDHKEAIKWYIRSAHKGNTTAQTNLAILYLESDQISQNVTEAIMWLKEAANLNNINAQSRLGSMYELGHFLDQDLNEAIKWYRYAVEQGDIESLEAINRIREREDYIEDYSLFLRRLGITKADADALYCENFLWLETSVYKIFAYEESNNKLDKFTDKAFTQISFFRKNLDEKLKLEEYENNPNYNYTKNLMDRNKEIFLQNTQEIEKEEINEVQRKILLERKESGIFNLVLDDIFLNNYWSINEEESSSLWDYCTSTHIGSSWFRSDIGLSSLKSAFDGISTTQKVYYSSLNYGERVVDWAKTKYESIKQLDVCDGDYDLPGGISIGTAATSLMAGDSILMIIGASGVYVATAPAIATGVTVAAVTGATVYATARGYCFFYGDKDEEELDTSKPAKN